jgi:hypothetical protein
MFGRMVTVAGTQKFSATTRIKMTVQGTDAMNTSAVVTSSYFKPRKKNKLPPNGGVIMPMMQSIVKRKTNHRGSIPI